jgi:hypothetical protein
MFNVSFDIIYKMKMGFTLVQTHDKGASKWRIIDEKFESCFCDENETKNIWVKADVLVLDPNAVYTIEPEMKDKNDRERSSN